MVKPEGRYVWKHFRKRSINVLQIRRLFQVYTMCGNIVTIYCIITVVMCGNIEK